MKTKSATTGQRGVGRPLLPASDRLNHRIPVGLNPAERALVDVAAGQAHITRSAWIRTVILRAAANAHTETA
jgi:hypothetical protein